LIYFKTFSKCHSVPNSAQQLKKVVFVKIKEFDKTFSKIAKREKLIKSGMKE
jgi:hypothetical protein